jgi:S1-C subfamily serine protease
MKGASQFAVAAIDCELLSGQSKPSVAMGGEACMARRLISFCLALAAGMAASTAFAAGPFGSIHVGNWNGGAYTDEKTGAFSHCSAGTAYGSGVNLLVGLNAGGNWLLAFAHPAWKLNLGETFAIDVTFDGQAQFHLFGTVLTSNLVTAVLPNTAAMDQFRKSHLMVAVAKGQTFQFNLDATGQLLPVIANCAAKTKSGGTANAGDFAITVPKLPVAKPVVQSTAPSPGPPKSSKTFEKNGTGFVVSASGHIVTNQHVIDGCVGDVNGNLSGEASINLRIVSVDETNDLALLQALGNFKEVAAIRENPIHPGDAIIAIGYPFHGLLTSDFTVTAGIVSSLSGLLNDTRFLQISAAVQPGNSGGPLLDTSGNVVGVVAAKINALKFAKATGDFPENINFAIKTGAVRDFLDNSVVSYQTAEPKSELKAAEIARNARGYTMLISCTAIEKN